MARKSRKNVGLIGLGIIGTRVAQVLRAGGFQVFVWNRTPKPAPNFLGAPADIAEICDVIQLFVADSKALFSVIDQLSDSLTANHVIVCSATVGPEATLEAARTVQDRGAMFLDAPFTGSKLAAEKRQLVYYVGGNEAALKKAEPMLKASSRAIVRSGEIGHAAVLKVATNMITAVTTQTLSEALALVMKAGLSPAAFADAIEHNACRSGTTDIKLPKMVAADYEPHFSLKHMFKDVQFAIHMANALDIEVPATTVTAGVMYGALNHGWADLDFASVFKLYEGAFAGMQSARPAQIEVPAPQPAAPNGQQPAKEAPKEPPKTAGIEVVPPAPAAGAAKAGEDPKPMEVVADVPRDAKPAGETTADEATKTANQAKPAPLDPEPGGKAKPFNRLRRFFAPSGK